MDQQGDQKGHLRAKLPLSTLDIEIKRIRMRETSMPLTLDIKKKEIFSRKTFFPLSPLFDTLGCRGNNFGLVANLLSFFAKGGKKYLETILSISQSAKAVSGEVYF